MTAPLPTPATDLSAVTVVMDEASFYAADPRRRTSEEAEYGALWRYADAGGDDLWRLAYVCDTGELFAGRRLSGAERRTLFRDQFFMLLLDEKQALASLPKLLPTQAEREAVMDMVRKVLSATGELSPARKDRLARVESILMEPAGAESRGRPA